MLDVWLLSFCRVAPVVALHPVFGGRTVPRTITIATAAALTFAMVQLGGAPVSAGTTSFVMLGVRELAIGVTIGILGQAVFGVIEAAGRFVDDARGANLAHLYAPQIEAVASPIGQIELAASLAIFWGLRLHAPMIDALATSYDSLPIGDGRPVVPSIEEALAVASALARAGLMLAGPAVSCCVLVDVSMGLVNRSAPTANVFLLSQSIKLTAAVFVTALGMPAQVEVWGDLWRDHVGWISSLFVR